MTVAANRTPVAVTRALCELGTDLAIWRRLRHLTAVEVANRAGLSRDTVLRVEKGKGSTLENALRIARALGVLEELVRALDPYATDVGRLRADEALSARVRRSGSANKP